MKKINFFSLKYNEGDIRMCVECLKAEEKKKKKKFVSDLNYELINKKVK